MKKKFKMEYLLYAFIILSPIFDAGSYMFKLAFPDSVITPTLIIRPIIPLVLLGYLFYKEKKYRLPLILSALIYIVYGIIHLYITKSLLVGISMGTVIQEAQYVINYTYMIYLLLIFIYFRNEKRLTYLSETMFASLGIYLIIIYFSIISGTSGSTYIEGIGYKSYFVSGNSLCTILLMLLVNTFDSIKVHRTFSYIFYILTGIYMVFLVGTRTGMIGFLLITFIYLGLRVFDKKKITKKQVLSGVGVAAIVILALCLFGSQTINRRILMKNESNGIIDVNTGVVGHTTGSTGEFVKAINDGTIDKSTIREDQINAYLDMYETANKIGLSSNNTRAQQFLFNIYLIKHQHNLLYLLFGNGFVVNYGEMTLEMEVFAILFNFGIFGFILYLIPFIYVFIKLIKKLINHKKKDVNDMMRVIMVAIVFGLSFVAGYVFFSGSCVLMLISLMSLICKEDRL